MEEKDLEQLEAQSAQANIAENETRPETQPKEEYDDEKAYRNMWTASQHIGMFFTPFQAMKM